MDEANKECFTDAQSPSLCTSSDVWNAIKMSTEPCINWSNLDFSRANILFNLVEHPMLSIERLRHIHSPIILCIVNGTRQK